MTSPDQPERGDLDDPRDVVALGQEGVAVACGVAIGAICRWAAGEAVDIGAAADGTFPSVTLAVNLLGCLLIGLASIRVVGTVPRAFLVTGLLGGFTTMSAFGVEVYELSEAGRGDLAAGYVAASVIGGVAAVWVGSARVGRRADGSTR